VQVRGSLYMTTFKKVRSTTVMLTHKPVHVSDGLQCFVNAESGQLHCRSAFRWPGVLVYAKVRNDTQLLWPFISYSPFPAGLHLSYLEEHYGSGPPPSAPEATIVVTERLAHIRSDFTIEKFDMESFLAGPR
jgi:hypothetical protein